MLFESGLMNFVKHTELKNAILGSGNLLLIDL
jgi:hypothetical protein